MNHYLQYVLILVLAIAPGVRAQESAALAEPAQATTEPAPSGNTPEVAPIKLLTNYVEVGGSYQPLSNGFGHWSGGYARGVVTQGANVWFAEINGQHEFSDAGTYFGFGDTYTINPDWYGTLTLGTSAGGFFWPKFRADAFINKKWLKRRQFITNVGYGYYLSKDVHHDNAFSVGAVYYFEKPWILEQGVRFNVSHPGAVFSPSGFVAVTQGHDKHHYVTVRMGLGEEAYQLVGPTASLNDFTSQTYTITWRQWTGKTWGFNLIGDFYHSPFYFRGGSMLGIFKDF